MMVVQGIAVVPIVIVALFGMLWTWRIWGGELMGGGGGGGEEGGSVTGVG